jgi:hypothetical protein
MSAWTNSGQRNLGAFLPRLRVGIFSLALFSGAGAFGCAAVFPEYTTGFRPPPRAGLEEPPPDLYFIHFERALIPKRTLDGRQWDEVGGKAPDPYAALMIGDAELLRTPVQSNTLEPTWSDAKLANYRVPRGARVRLELWDENAVLARPICIADLGDLRGSEVEEAVREIACATGAKVWLRVEPPRALFGLGLWYEVRPREVIITRVIEESPAGRAGLRAGQRILHIQGKAVTEMQDGEAMSLFNANARSGLELGVADAQGSSQTVSVREGAVYPEAHENVPLR